MIADEWQDPNPAAYNADNPLELLEIAAGKEGTERTTAAVWAVGSMLAAGANFTALTVARRFAKEKKLLTFGEFDKLVREGQGAAGQHDNDVKSASTMLVELAQQRYSFGVSDTGEPFAVPHEGPRVVAMLRGGKTSLRALMAREYFTVTGRAATQQALADALMVIEGIAQDADESRLYLRTARHGGALWLDLGDSTGRVVRVTPHGWTVEEQAPVLFRRTALTAALPEPKRGGSLDRLWDWLNVAEKDRPLVLAEQVARLFSDVPHVILGLFGEQGTGKTTALRVVVSLTDPSPVPVRKSPRDADSWITAAAGSWVVGLDNLSDIPPWLSDSLCRASTGDGDVRRKLYTDGDYAVFSFRRCIVFTTIDVGALAPDLADRTVAITLNLISDEDRADEQEFWSQWQDAHPLLLGALLDLAARVLARLPAARLPKKPRMADFARVLAAVDAELETSAYDRYTDQAKSLAAESLADDAFAAAITRHVTSLFEGNSAALLKLVTPTGEWERPKDWPKKSGQVTGRMTRLAPSFRKTGWTVENLGSNFKDNVVHWRISPPPRTETSGEEPRQPSPDSPDARAARVGEAQDGPSSCAPEEKPVCAVCKQPMTPIPGQDYHPGCDPKEHQ